MKIHESNLKDKETSIYLDNFNKVVSDDQLLEFYLLSTGNKDFYFENKDDEDEIKTY
jgi:hypothetical protein